MQKTRTILSIFLIFGTFFATLHSQEDKLWFWGKKISAVQWDGIIHSDRRELDFVAKGFIGKAFTQDLWTEFQARLFELDWFETIEPSAIAVPGSTDQITIKIQVTEKPSVESVKTLGNVGLKQSDILDVVGTKIGDIYNPAKAKLDEIAVHNLYLEKGYPDAKVVVSTKPGKSTNGVVLTFTVSEGSQVTIKSISFIGNDNISAQTLKGKLSLKEAGFLQAGVFQDSKVEADKTELIDFYRSRGFVDAAVSDVLRSYEKDAKSSKNWILLTFVIKEGPKWLFGGMKFEGNTIFTTIQLQKYIKIKPGSVLDYKKLLSEKANIDDLYSESGYISNTLELVEQRDLEKSTISYILVITERDRAHIEAIIIKGNRRTKDSVILREIPIEVGDTYSKAKLIEGLRNLYNLRYFSAIQPDVHMGSAENLAVLVFNVEEQSTADIQFGVNLSGLGDPNTFPLAGSVKWDDRNFLGNGTDLNVQANVGQSNQTISTGYFDNYFFGDKFSAGLNLAFSHTTVSTGTDMVAPIFLDGVPDPFYYPVIGGYPITGIPSAYIMPYEDWSISLGNSVGYTFHTPAGDLGIGTGLVLGIGMKTFDQDKFRPALNDLRVYRGQWRWGNTLSTRVSLNNLDLWYSPGNGYYASEKVSWVGLLPYPIESQQYMRSDSKVEAYYTLFDLPLFQGWSWKIVVGVHSGFSVIFPKPWTTFSVTDDWLYLDGIFNARGWRNLYGLQGTSYWENWLEMRMPVFEQFLWIDGFLDASMMRTTGGMVNMNGIADPSIPEVNPGKKDWSSLSWENVAFDLGVGLRFSLPQFPLRFYFAWRFVYDGDKVLWKTKNGVDIVISITQPLN